VQCPGPVEGLCRQGEIRLGEFLSPPEQAHGDKEIGKKSTPEPGTVRYWAEPPTRWYRADFRHRGRIRHGADRSYARDAQRPSTSARGRERTRIGKIGPSPCLLEPAFRSVRAGRSYGRPPLAKATGGTQAAGRRSALLASGTFPLA
jgi:hypothetical protein